MSVVSIRFSDPDVQRRLRDAAGTEHRSASAVAERLIDEGLRMSAHPSIVFVDGATGRRPALRRGPEVADVIGMLVGGDVPVEQRRERAAALLSLPLGDVDAALAYYADHTDEVDADLAARVEAARVEEARWRRQQELLGR